MGLKHRKEDAHDDKTYFFSGKIPHKLDDDQRDSNLMSYGTWQRDFDLPQFKIIEATYPSWKNE